MYQKNELSGLSLKARGLYLTAMMEETALFTFSDFQQLCKEKRTAISAAVAELMAANLATFHAQAPGRKACYEIRKTACRKSQNFSSTSTTSTAVFNLKKECRVENQQSALETQADFQTLCKTYGLAPAFIASKVALRKKTIGGNVDMAFISGVLKYAQAHVKTNLPAFVHRLFLSPEFENPYGETLPQFATMKQPIAQESGYNAPQAAPERQAASSIAPPVVTPPRATQTATGAKLDAWKAYMQKRLTDPSSYKTWIAPCSATRDAAGHVTIIVPMNEHAFWLNEYYVQALTDAFQHAGTPAKSLQFVVQSQGVNG